MFLSLYFNVASEVSKIWFYKCYIAMCNNSKRKMLRRAGKPSLLWSSHEGPAEPLWNCCPASKLLFLLEAGGRSRFFCSLSVGHPFSFKSLCTFSPFSAFFFSSHLPVPVCGLHWIFFVGVLFFFNTFLTTVSITWSSVKLGRTVTCQCNSCQLKLLSANTSAAMVAGGE